MGDSRLVINQLKGENKVAAKNLIESYNKSTGIINNLRERGVKVSIKWIPREENIVADELSHIPLKEYCEEKGIEMCECGGILTP